MNRTSRQLNYPDEVTNSTKSIRRKGANDFDLPLLRANGSLMGGAKISCDEGGNGNTNMQTHFDAHPRIGYEESRNREHQPPPGNRQQLCLALLSNLPPGGEP